MNKRFAATRPQRLTFHINGVTPCPRADACGRARILPYPAALSSRFRSARAACRIGSV